MGGVILFCIVFSWLFDYKFDFTNEQTQSRLEKLDAAVFISRNDSILEAIQSLQKQIEGSKSAQKKTGKRKAKRH